MIKRTLFFGNPAYLSLKNAQLVIRLNDAQTQQEVTKTVPIEDIGILCITDKQFGDMEIFSNCKPKAVDMPCQQLELF